MQRSAASTRHTAADQRDTRQNRERLKFLRVRPQGRSARIDARTTSHLATCRPRLERSRSERECLGCRPPVASVVPGHGVHAAHAPPDRAQSEPACQTADDRPSVRHVLPRLKSTHRRELADLTDAATIEHRKLSVVLIEPSFWRIRPAPVPILVMPHLDVECRTANCFLTGLSFRRPQLVTPQAGSLPPPTHRRHSWQPSPSQAHSRWATKL